MSQIDKALLILLLPYLLLAPLAVRGLSTEASAARIKSQQARPTNIPDTSPDAAAAIKSADPFDRSLVSRPAIAADESPFLWPPSRPGFFLDQLDLCRRVVFEASTSRDAAFSQRPTTGSGFAPPERKKFVEHPRCTARFGEVLLHSFREAYTDEEREKAAWNARNVLSYAEKHGAEFVRDGLTSDLAASLSSPAVRRFRRKQLDACDEERRERKQKAMGGDENDFTPEESDLNVLGRLYYSAILASGQYLDEVGLTGDHGGFTALLALCRAASAASTGAAGAAETKIAAGNSPAFPPRLSPAGCALDAAVSDHFNGVSAPGSRFLFSSRHGIRKGRICGRRRKARARSGRLVVAFSSLGNGLVRHEFGGSLAKLNNDFENEEDDAFDVLFVADPSQSWYQKDSRGGFSGFEEYEARIRAASGPYRSVSLVGDSMGGSAALLFAHLATDSVVSFSPQVDLEMDSDHVSRDDMTSEVRMGASCRLAESVDWAVKKGVRVNIHRGVEEMDVRHTERLLECLPEEIGNGNDEEDMGTFDLCHRASAGRLRVVEHAECTHHQVAVFLKRRGSLLKELSFELRSP